MNKYYSWILKFVTKAYGRCEQYSKEMQKEFPELILCKGFYYCPYWGRRQHWWLKTETGEIVDPTYMQFPSVGLGKYEEISDDELEDKVPSGVCLECGDPVYRGKTFCSKTCETLTVQSLM